jgi:hypothetical protein
MLAIAIWSAITFWFVHQSSSFLVNSFFSTSSLRVFSNFDIEIVGSTQVVSTSFSKSIYPIIEFAFFVMISSLSIHNLLRFLDNFLIWSCVKLIF